MPFIAQGPEGEQAPYRARKTNWKFLLIIIILAAIVGGGAFYCSFKFLGLEWPPIKLSPKTEKGIVVTTDKMKYEYVGELEGLIKITVKNNLDKTICFQSCNTYYLEKKENGKWEKLDTIQCFFNTITECLKPGETKIFEDIRSWKKEGTYKFAVPTCINCEGLEDFRRDQTINSNEFLVKQKSGDETADWKTYRNEEYGFEMKYPEEWIFEERNSEIGFRELSGERRSVEIFIRNNSSGLLLNQWLEYYESSTGVFLMEKKPILINGIEGIKGLDYFADIYLEEIFLPKENKIYNISFLFGGMVETDGVPIRDKEGIYNQILSTFSFIEEFCGTSTYGSCASDSDCIAGGCSGQLCQSKNDELLGTTCEWKECYRAKDYGFECSCVDKKCQWAE